MAAITTLYPPVYANELPRSTDQLNDFVFHSIIGYLKDKPIDSVTPKKVLWEMMKDRETNMLIRKPAARMWRVPIRYRTPDNSVDYSLSNDVPDDSYDMVDTSTQATYYPLFKKQYLAIGDAEWALASGDGRVELVKERKESCEEGFSQGLNTILFSGKTSGSEYVSGLTEMIQFDTTSNPTRGSVGVLDQTNSLFSFWKNRTNNFNAAYKTLVGGGMNGNVFGPATTGLLDLYTDCSDNIRGEDGEPNVFVCNRVLWNYINDLADNNGKRIFIKEKPYNLAVEQLMYKRAVITWDTSIPNDPNNSAYGVGWLLNTNDIKFIVAEGMEKSWGEMEKVPGKGAKAWPMSTCYGITCTARNSSGVIYGVQGAAVS